MIKDLLPRVVVMLIGGSIKMFDCVILIECVEIINDRFVYEFTSLLSNEAGSVDRKAAR